MVELGEFKPRKRMSFTARLNPASVISHHEALADAEEGLADWMEEHKTGILTGKYSGADADLFLAHWKEDPRLVRFMREKPNALKGIAGAAATAGAYGTAFCYARGNLQAEEVIQSATVGAALGAIIEGIRSANYPSPEKTGRKAANGFRRQKETGEFNDIHAFLSKWKAGLRRSASNRRDYIELIKSKARA